MPRRAAWPIAVAIAAAASPARAQIAIQPLPGVEAGIVVLPGVQTEPALSRPFGSFVAYTDRARSPSEVWYCRLNGLTCPAFQVPASGGNQYQPAVAGDLLVYVDEGPNRTGNVVRLSLSQGYSSPVSPVNALQVRPAVSSRLIAWEDQRDPASGTDIWVHDNLLGGEWSITGPGAQRRPRTSGTLVSYLDDAAGNVKIYDLASGVTSVAYPAPAAFADVDGTALTVENAVGDVEVWSTGGTRLAALVMPGEQTNPHISGEWVAFEDKSTLVSRVMVWNWKLGGLYAPPAGTSSQILNDISWPRVVYVDDRSPATGQDIFLFDTSAAGGGGGGSGCEPDEDGEDCDQEDDGGDGHDRGGQAGRCAEVAAAPLAELRVTRLRGAPRARNVEFAVAAEVPALVCVDAGHLSSGWVLLDREAVARPDDFDVQVTHLERRFSVAAGLNQLGAMVAGKPGSWLSVKVFPDPGGGPAPVAGAALRLPAAATASPEAPGQGCGSGPAGLLAALPLAGWLRRRRRSGP